MFDKKSEKSLNIAHKRWKFEIELLWKRAWLFWGFTAVGFVAYAYCIEHARSFGYGAALMVAAFGTFTSLIWTFANRGSKFWQDSWDEYVKQLEKKVLGRSISHDIKTPKNKGCFGGIRFSPSRLIIALSQYITGSWAFILIMQIAIMIGFAPRFVVSLFAPLAIGATAIYAVLVYFETKKHYD